MDDSPREDMHADIRRLLKTFGVQAGEVITAYTARYPQGEPLHLQITLECLPEGGPDTEPLHFRVEGKVRRQ